VGAFSSIKGHYHSALNSKILHNSGVPLSVHDVGGCSKTDTAMPPVNIYSAFKKTGIFPFDPYVFTDDDFMISEVRNRVMQENGGTSPSSSLQESVSSFFLHSSYRGTWSEFPEQ
jgi:hypothetical protein